VFSALVTCPDGRLLCAIRGKEGPEIVVFDPESRAFTDRIAPPDGGPVDNGLQVGPDGRVYGVTHNCIFRLEPASLAIDEIVAFPEPLRGHAAAGPIINGELYYSSGHRLIAARIL